MFFGTEFILNFCARIGPLQLGFVLVLNLIIWFIYFNIPELGPEPPEMRIEYQWYRTSPNEHFETLRFFSTQFMNSSQSTVFTDPFLNCCDLKANLDTRISCIEGTMGCISWLVEFGNRDAISLLLIYHCPESEKENMTQGSFKTVLTYLNLVQIHLILP